MEWPHIFYEHGSIASGKAHMVFSTEDFLSLICELLGEDAIRCIEENLIKDSYMEGYQEGHRNGLSEGLRHRRKQREGSGTAVQNGSQNALYADQTLVL